MIAAFFIAYQSDAAAPGIRVFSNGETTTRIGTRIAGFEVFTADLQESVILLRETMRRVIRERS
ncbi:MAG: hypothetical protein U9R74_04385 [Pseudomonadota bacterium]|nr:hypothetical protein [Pseudomonadota bacterium]